MIKSAIGRSDISQIRNELLVGLNFRHPHLIEVKQIHIYAEKFRPVNVDLILPYRIPVTLGLIRSWSLEFRLRACYQLIDVLAFLQEHGICHGDIKIDNLVCDKDRIQLIDFGLITHRHDVVSVITQSFYDEHKLAHEDRLREGYDNVKCAAFTLGITLSIILDPELGKYFGIGDFHQPQKYVTEILNDPQVWLAHRPTLAPLQSILGQLLCPIDIRQTQFSQLLLNTDYLRVHGQYVETIWQPQLPYPLPRVITELYNQSENFFIFETAVELHVMWYNEFRDTTSFDDYIRATLAMSEMLCFSKKSVVDSSCLQPLYRYIQLTNFNFMRPSRVKSWDLDVTICCLYALVKPEHWHKDILSKITRHYAVSTQPRGSIVHWLHEVALSLGLDFRNQGITRCLVNIHHLDEPLEVKLENLEEDTTAWDGVLGDAGLTIPDFPV
jgi:serine/threonine protein kinase